MNERFFSLPPQRRSGILEAAYEVFSKNGYDKAPMSEIAARGGISKSLLFHYFKNKRELYMYLWKNAMELTRRAVARQGTLETDDFFEMLRRSLASKCAVMRAYPLIYSFALRAYYEPPQELEDQISRSYSLAAATGKEKALAAMDMDALRGDVDARLIYKEIFYAIEGYMLGKYRTGSIDPDEIEREMTELIDFWEKLYGKKEEGYGA